MTLSYSQRLQIQCEECSAEVKFSLLDRSESKPIRCEGCGKKYIFDEDLIEQLTQFEALCKQIHASEKILGSTSIAIDVGHHHVKVPFNILLTRLNSVIELVINGKKRAISFRVDPLKDL